MLVLALLVFAIAATAATAARGNAARQVSVQSAPELVAAENLYGSLADADATASTIFLRAGQEAPALRQRYLDDVKKAGGYLAAVARSSEGAADARKAVATISEQLPAYTGLVETARANNRQGFPVGGAYLSQASALMRDKILPAATQLYRDAALRLDDNYRSGSSTATLVIVAVAGVAMLALLLAVQIFVRRRSNRILNLGLVGATVVVLGLLAWTLVCFAAGHDALNRAQQRGSDSVEVLSSARILTLRAQSNENLALIERGTSDTFVSQFDHVMRQLGGKDGTGGLLGYAAGVADRIGDGSEIRTLSRDFTDLQKIHSEVRTEDAQGRYNDAVGSSVGTSGVQGPELTAVQRLGNGMQTQIMRAQDRLQSAAHDAQHGFGVLVIAIPVFAVIAGLLVLLGIERRIAEYR